MKKIIASLLFISLSALFSACIFDSEDDGWSAAKVCPVSKRGTFTDERDGRVYKYTTIGKQVWMAENLNYKADGSVCYYKEDDCYVMGRIYDVDESLCPNGWHIPSREEWDQLILAVGGESLAKSRLKATYGWNVLNEEENPNGTDDCGFSAVYGYNGYPKRIYESSFLTSSKVENHDVNRVISFFSYELNTMYCGLSCGFSKTYLRCLKD